MDDNTKKEEMYNRIKAEYANTSEKILKIIEESKNKKKDENEKDRGEEK